jgi:hypothetical protein
MHDGYRRKVSGVVVKFHSDKKHRILSLGLAILVLALVGGCASQHAYLVPAPVANLTNGGHAAMATSEGVTIKVTPNAWDGRPHNLYKRVTPLKVRIENQSKQPIRLVYQDFALETPHGERLAALPPSEIRDAEYIDQNRMPYGAHVVDAAWQGPAHHEVDRRGRPRVIFSPGFAWYGFYYAPYWNYGYIGIGPWPYPWIPDFGYFSTYYPYMRAIHLPTRSMLTKGIPEGVVAPGGYVEGFLYFTKVKPDMEQVEFVAKLQNARTGQQFGTIRVPFEVKRRSSY